MLTPLKWIVNRPGILIPVFFLPLIRVSAQTTWQEAAVVSQGNTFVTRRGFYTASHNQAGLGWLDQHSLSMQHIRPLNLENLGISSLGLQVNMGNGTCGTTLTTCGIRGLRQTSLWISYGKRLTQGMAVGLGIHLWTSTIQDQIFYHPGASFALGIQVKMNDRIMTGAHVLHPMGWHPELPVNKNQQMVLAAGFTYTAFKNISYSFDLHALPEQYLQLCHGVELNLNERLRIQTGMHNHPFAISAGISMDFSSNTLLLAFEYMLDYGVTPVSSLSHAW